ncbi:MAG: DnaJ domain-containing protein [Candidatus Cloacimonetes bacterium]|nr:J domain-containing protein [Candidatus Cloacimonadota bacterium]MDD4156603.1 DnaJ domain-containing protein [Candidatus Cloacimonadota bacterium]
MSNEIFNGLLNSFENLEEFLTEQNRLMYESEIIRYFFPNISIANCNNLYLYQIHFVLFHKLYILKSHIENQGYFVNIHFMKAGAVKLPSKGNCKFFNTLTNQFCKKAIQFNEDFCAEHIKYIEKKSLLDLQSIEFFYLDKDNFDFFDETILEKWYQGFNYTVKNYEYFKTAVSILNLQDDFKLNELKSNYRKLALKCHPDHNQEKHKRFLEINRAYQFLLKCIN